MGAIGITPVSVTIANGTSLSAAAPLGDSVLTGIAMPAAWDAAGLSFQVSADGGATWGEMQSISAVVSVTAALGQYIALDPAIWRGINMIKVRSGTAAAPVAQTADRVLTLVTKRMI
ncbi:hypothetical protein SAMN05444159_1273 [Bradyrhizobium lablabi]|uniref:Uncharacterized protein n=1 Tax=Bradyrhizobium lablabi TaxID=722472 RepID=A0A1M6LGZ0_9BRAD|nr:hypothetical protein [Bradyrhizobium lablabi]SHJ70439.1 hypothetical protein SAMN05444159_1273 [Bradyrhizobium lablabi]